MEKKSDSLNNKIDSVVDEIFAEFNANSAQEIKENVDKNKQQQETTPPPIPLIDDYTSDQTQVEIVNQTQQQSVIIDTVDSSFMDEVLNVINNDIKPKEVTLDLEGIVSNSNEFIDDSSNTNNQNIRIIKKDNSAAINNEINQRFNVESNDIIENITFKSSVDNLNNINNSVEYLLKQQEVEYLKQAQQKIDEFKDNKLKDMQQQINQLTNWFNEYKLNQANATTKDLTLEQENLKQFYSLLNEITLSQRQVKQDFDKVFSLLNNLQSNQDE